MHAENIFNTIKTGGHSSFEKYTSLFIERVVSERELETEQNCNILTPTLMSITAFLSRSPGLLNREPAGPASLRQGSHSNIFSPTDLNFLSPGLYNDLTSTYFLRASQFRTRFNPLTVKVASNLLISSTGCTCYLYRCISHLTAWPGRRSICNNSSCKDPKRHLPKRLIMYFSNKLYT